MDPTSAATALFHTVNSHIRSNVIRTASFVRTGQPELRPNPFNPSRPLVLEPLPSARALHQRLAELGVHADPQLLDAIRKALAEHMHAVFFNFITAIDGEGAFYAPDGREAQLELRIRDGDPLPGGLHDAFPAATLD